MRASEEALKQVMADVFRIQSNAIDERASIDTIKSWDSSSHLKLVLALEERFDISFTEEESVEILSYPLIRVVLQGHGIRFE